MNGIDGSTMNRMSASGALNSNILNPNIQDAIPGLAFQHTAAPVEQAHIRVLHVMDHMLRGSIESWLYQMIQQLDPQRFSHHILVLTDGEKTFTDSLPQTCACEVPRLHFTNPMHLVWNFVRMARQHGPYDVVHVHGASMSGLLSLLLARMMGVDAVVVHSHDDISPALKTSGLHHRLYRKMVDYFYKSIPDLGFACSERAAVSMFGKQWRKDERFRLLYYGIDFSRFALARNTELRNTLGIPHGAFVVGHVGSFHEQKNHAFLLNVAAETVRYAPDVHFLLIGDGPLRPQVQGEIERRGLAKHFTIVPEATRASDTTAIAGYMTGAMDCFVLPSRYEGLGLVAVEAQAAGLPCLLSDRVPAEAIVDHSLIRVLSLDGLAADVWAASLLQLKQAGPRPTPPDHLDLFHASRFNAEACAGDLAAVYRNICGRVNLESA